MCGHLKGNIKAKRKCVDEKEEENKFSLVVENHSMWKTKILPFFTLYKFCVNLFIHKFFSIISMFFGPIIRKWNVASSYKTRNVELIGTFVPINTKFKFSIRYAGREVWNRLSAEVKVDLKNSVVLCNIFFFNQYSRDGLID